MDDFLANVDLGQLLAGGGTLTALVIGFRLVAQSSNFATRTYREAATYSDARGDALEAKIAALDRKIAEMADEIQLHRDLKHDWRSFAGSLYQERWTIRRFAEIHGCGEVAELMDRLDKLRAENPLMDDVKSMTEGDT